MIFFHWINKSFNYLKLYFLLFNTLLKKECSFAPFVGEFGHLLSHFIPFVSYLHSKGVKVHVCAPQIHKVFFYDKIGNPIYETFTPLRDFYSEVSPKCNMPIYPVDLHQKINKYVNKKKKYVFWNILNHDLYWNGFCTWMYHNNLVKIYKHKGYSNFMKNIKPRVVLFARSKGSHSPVRGSDWDFNLLIDQISSYCSSINVLGHPAFSKNIKKKSNVNVLVGHGNEVILRECCKADYIITQLSGVHYLGLYCSSKILLLIKGKYDPSNIIKDTKYRKKLGDKLPMTLIDNKNKLIEILSSNE